MTGTDDDSDGRRRRAYELTAAGERALHDWLASDSPLSMELRHEGALKLFFADALDPDEQLALVRAHARGARARAGATCGPAPTRDRARRAQALPPTGARVGHRAERVLRGLVQSRGAGDRGRRGAPDHARRVVGDRRPPPPQGRGRRARCWPWWPARSAAAWPTGSTPTAPTTRPARATARSSCSSARGRTRSTDVVALVRPRQSVRSPAGRAEVLAVAAELRRDPDVARVSTFREGGECARVARRPGVLRGGQLQAGGGGLGRGRAPARPLRGTPARGAGRRRDRQHRGQRAGVGGPGAGRAAGPPVPVPPLVPLLPERRGRPAAADGGDHHDPAHVPVAAHRQRARVGVGVRPQFGHRTRARPGHRLQPLRRVPVPGGDGAHRGPWPGPPAHAGHGRPHGSLQLPDGGRRDVLPDRVPAALPLLDGHRRRAGGAAGQRRGAHPPPRRAHAARAARERARAAAAPAGPRARGAAATRAAAGTGCRGS